jgi:hypothetical protein
MVNVKNNPLKNNTKGIYMHDDTAISYLQRSLQYLIRPGNLLYCGLLAAVFIALRLLGDERLAGRGILIWGIVFVFIALFACKMLDSIQRLRYGLEHEAVPYGLLSKLTPGVAGEAAVVVLFCGVVLLLLHLPPQNDSRELIAQILAVALYVLAPAVILALFQGEGLSALFNPAAWKRALNDIGITRYLIVLAIPLLVALFLVIAYTLLVQQALSPADQRSYNSSSGAYGAPPVVYLIVALRGIILTLLFTLPLLYSAWFYPPPPETLDPEQLDIDESELAHINMDDALLAELNRLKAEEERLANHHRRAPPVDLNLLREADTEGMSAEEQRNFAGDLTQADVLIRQGENDQAIALLEKYTDGMHDTGRYLPAYKRLHQLYRRQKREDEMQMMEMRLIEATASGNPHSYVTIHQTLNEIADGVLPADWIYPLAQAAASKQHHDTVLALTRNFAKHHPEHPHIVDNYFLSARTLAKKGDLDKSQQLLQQLLKRYPDHTKATQIRRTLELLQQRSAHA